jgi:hypothetical protein
MAVISVLTDTKRSPALMVAACMYGIPAEVVEVDGDKVFIDLAGDPGKAALAIYNMRRGRKGVTANPLGEVVAQVDSAPRSDVFEYSEG